MGEAQYDQRQVALLAKDWNQVTPPEVYNYCMPAFLHRVSRRHAVLVLYVSTEEGMEHLKRTPGVDWLVRHLHKKRTELQEIWQRIAFVHKPELDLEQIRLHSVVMGEIETEKFSTVTEIKNNKSATSTSKTTLSAKEQFTKIRMHINEGNSNAGNSA